MTMNELKHWQDPLNALIGLGVIFSPWVFGFQDQDVLVGNAIVVGLALVAVALGAIFVPSAWEEWTEGALGAWLIVSPWVLGFSAQRDATLGAVIAGMVVVALAVWTLLVDENYRGWWHDRAAH